jgi:DNA-binding HxlR family transcriptional regulator
MQDDALTERSPLPSAVHTDPWSGLNESGDNLTVDNFITTVMSQTVNALRRVTTLPYARRFVQSTSDKALVSRTLRLLEQRGLVSLQAEGPTPRKRLTCNITPAGQALHAQVIPVARKAQASMIQLMTPEERRVMYVALKRIHRQCLEADASAGEDEDS